MLSCCYRFVYAFRFLGFRSEDGRWWRYVNLDFKGDAIEVVTSTPAAMSETGVSSNAGAGPSRQPQKPPVKNPPVVTPGSGSNIIVNQRQASTTRFPKRSDFRDKGLRGGGSGKIPCSNA